MRILSFIVLILCTQLACTGQEPVHTLKLGGGQHIVLLLDSTEAAATLTVDRRDRYFDLVNASEMSIQMKKMQPQGISRENLLPAYVDFLKHDVQDFDLKESKFTAEVMEKIYKTCANVSQGIFPDTIKLIKTKGTHYGDGVYYTRENCIIIPANELKAGKTNPFTTTMFHELFHVYSRLHPEKRVQLYRLIGFEHIGLESLRLPAGLAERILYNPDGVDFGQKIHLAVDSVTQIDAIPVIYSNNVGFKAGQLEFFGYLGFNLYQIVANGDGSWRVVVKPDGFSSTLNVEKLPDYFRQIKDNTGYIIHPDEVLADNFSFIMMEKTGSKLTMKFSPDGKKLLRDIEAVITGQ